MSEPHKLETIQDETQEDNALERQGKEENSENPVYLVEEHVGPDEDHADVGDQKGTTERKETISTNDSTEQESTEINEESSRGETQEMIYAGEKQQLTSLTNESLEVDDTAETHTRIGEPLSEKEIPVLQMKEDSPISVPGTPERVHSPMNEAESKQITEELEAKERNELLEKYQNLVEEKEKISRHNISLQQKLAKHLNNSTREDLHHEKERSSSDQEQVYQRYIDTIQNLKSQHQKDSEIFHLQIEDLKIKQQEKINEVDGDWKELLDMEKEVLVAAFSGKFGKAAALKEAEQIQANEQRKETELIHMRLENIKLKNKNKKLESTLKAKEELEEGLNFIDFEQLKIESQTYNEKIEERNEELLKSHKKITNTVQVLTHVKEKLQFMQIENTEKKGQLMDLEEFVGQKQAILSRSKQIRDNLRMENVKLAQKCDLLENELLLRDFENKVDDTEVLSQKLKALKVNYAEFKLKCGGVKKKIGQAQTVEQ
ncbi:CCD96 protein, partial [Polypterus senegalus]